MKKSIFFETLNFLGGKRKGNSFSFVKNNLCIRHIDSGIKYTVEKVILSDDKKPYIYAYRYYGPEEKNSKVKRFYIKIGDSDFAKYEPV